MPIPDYQSIMLPLLKSVQDKQHHHIRSVIEVLASQFGLSEEDRKAMLPSGYEPTFDNRVSWAKTYLKKAGLVDNSKRGHIAITQKGLDVLKQNPEKINNAFLKRYPEFLAFQNIKSDNGNVKADTTASVEESVATPEELLSNAYNNMRSSLAHELLTRIISLSPQFFERLVVELIVKMGYGGSLQDAGRAVGRTGDEGIDGIIKEDKLGLDQIYIQAKRWKPGNTVGRPHIQQFLGALSGHGTRKGVFITTSSFTKEALGFINRTETKVVLVDGEQLAQLMIDYDLGVSTQQVYHIKKMDNDFFEEA